MASNGFSYATGIFTLVGGTRGLIATGFLIAHYMGWKFYTSKSPPQEFQLTVRDHEQLVLLQNQLVLLNGRILNLALEPRAVAGNPPPAEPLTSPRVPIRET